jgi:hypothetical protein
MLLEKLYCAQTLCLMVQRLLDALPGEGMFDTMLVNTKISNTSVTDVACILRENNILIVVNTELSYELCCLSPFDSTVD